MAYQTRYEPSASYIINGVLAWSQTYLQGGSEFTTTTQPTLAQVEQFIDQRVYEVAAKLEAAGYDELQPVADVGADVTSILSRAVIMGTMIDIEMTKQTTSLGRGETARWQLFEKRFDMICKTIAGSALEHLGATRNRAASAGMQQTGVSWGEQDDIDNDDDTKGAVFPRGLGEKDARVSRFTEISDPAS